MTIRRKDEPNAQVEVLNWGPGTKAYRFILLGAALAATPIGNNILASFGIKTPAMAEIAQVTADVASLKTDIASVKADVAAVKSKSDKLDTAFTGFEVDFRKFQKQHIEPQSK